jgi:hypothetical protein
LTKTDCIDKVADVGSDEARSRRWPVRVPRRLDKLVASGRITAREAEHLRAGAPEEVDGAVVGIRVRHAGARLDAAVAAGELSREEADSILDRLRAGEHSPELRARLNRLGGSASEGADPLGQRQNTDGGEPA